jgi:hypothetical protein
MVVDAGKTQILERQVTEFLNCFVDLKFAVFDLL